MLDCSCWRQRRRPRAGDLRLVGGEPDDLVCPGPHEPCAGCARKPLRRIYRICIGPNRARAPMHAPSKASRVELIFDRNNISGSYFQTGADGQLRPVEFLYRRLAAGRFEGSQDVTEADWISRTQYMAQRVAADCGPLQPQPMSESGEP